MRLINGFFAFTTLLAIAGLLTGPREIVVSTCLWAAVFFWHGIWFVATRNNVPSRERIEEIWTLGLVWIPVSMMTGMVLASPAVSLTPWVAAIILSSDVVYCLKKIAESLPQSLRTTPRQSAMPAQGVSLAGPIELMTKAEAEAQEQGRVKL